MIAAPMRLPAEASPGACAALLEVLPEIVAARGATLLIDASGVRRFDSTTIALVLQAQRLAQASGRSALLLGAPPGLLDLARLYGVDVLLPMGSFGEASRCVS